MKNLNLNLKRQWFDMFLSGDKLEEYREIKPSFCARFLLLNGEHKNASWWTSYISIWSVSVAGSIKWDLFVGEITFKEYDNIIFPNGMTPPIPQLEFEFKGFEIREGNPKWGAVEGAVYFVLKTGKLISKVNCPAERRGHPRMEIKDGQSYSDVASDMFDEFLETFTKENGLIRSINDNDREEFDCENISFIYTLKGHKLAERYLDRLGALGCKYFDPMDINIFSHRFQDV
jgi:hypothetical protein